MRYALSFDTFWKGVYAATHAWWPRPGRSSAMQFSQDHRTDGSDRLVSWASTARSRRDDELARRQQAARVRGCAEPR